MYAVKRNSEETRSEQKIGFKNMTKWVLKNCLKSGHLQGYVKASADQFWDDVERLVLNQYEYRRLEAVKAVS